MIQCTIPILENRVIGNVLFWESLAITLLFSCNLEVPGAIVPRICVYVTLDVTNNSLMFT